MSLLEALDARMRDPQNDHADIHYDAISTFEQRRQARLDWLTATTHERMCQLTAGWLDGTSPFLPGCYKDRPDDETELIKGQLIELNRLGILTQFSQPGLFLKPSADFGGCEQRASMSAMITKPLAEKILQLKCPDGLLVQVYNPGKRRGYRLNISRKLDGTEYTWSGDCAFDYVYACHEAHLTNQGMTVLKAAYEISIVDLAWRRNNLLWDWMVRSLSD